jgi:flagellar biosynthesis protein FlhG
MYWGKKIVIAVGGGKGGIGKSTFVANLGVCFAKNGKNVVVVDADLGAANLHTILGVPYPEKTLDDFLSKRETDLENTLVDTSIQNLRLLSSASDVLSIASPNYSDRQRLFKAIQRLKTDIVIFDIAAGTHQRATDFFSLAPIGIIIIEPIPTSLENAFSFIKNLLVRGLIRRFYHDKEITQLIQNTVDPKSAEKNLHFSDLLIKLEEIAPAKIQAYKQLFLEGVSKMFIVANSVKTSEQNLVPEKFARIVKRYLALNLEVLGTLPYEPTMDNAIVNRVPFVVKNPDSFFTKKMFEILEKIITISANAS